jgi:hypothetical protein
MDFGPVRRCVLQPISRGLRTARGRNHVSAGSRIRTTMTNNGSSGAPTSGGPGTPADCIIARVGSTSGDQYRAQYLQTGPRSRSRCPTAQARACHLPAFLPLAPPHRPAQRSDGRADPTSERRRPARGQEPRVDRLCDRELGRRAPADVLDAARCRWAGVDICLQTAAGRATHRCRWPHGAFPAHDLVMPDPGERPFVKLIRFDFRLRGRGRTVSPSARGPAYASGAAGGEPDPLDDG